MSIADHKNCSNDEMKTVMIKYKESKLFDKKKTMLQLWTLCYFLTKNTLLFQTHNLSSNFLANLYGAIGADAVKIATSYIAACYILHEIY